MKKKVGKQISCETAFRLFHSYWRQGRRVREDAPEQPSSFTGSGKPSRLGREAPWDFRGRWAGQEVTLIRPLRGHLPPGRGKALRAANSPPTKERQILPPHPPRICPAPVPIPSVAARHLPLIRGVGPPRGRFRGAPGFAPGALAWQSQARQWNRNSENFCKPRAQWPGRNRGSHSDFARRK